MNLKQKSMKSKWVKNQVDQHLMRLVRWLEWGYKFTDEQKEKLSQIETFEHNED